jgi:hypothetical protein
MTFLFCDGFDKYAADTDLAIRGWTIGSTAATAFNATGGAFGGGALDLGNTTLTYALAAAETEVVFGFRMKAAALPAADREILRFLSTANNRNIIVKLNTDGSFGAYQDATLRGTESAAVIEAGEWYRVEARAKSGSAASGANCTIEVNGVEVLGVDANFLVSFGTANVGSVVTLGASDLTLTLDDVTLVNTSGSAPWNTFLGDVAIATLTPTAEGDASDFTPSAGADNALMVDETVSDGDTTYNESSTVNHEDVHVHSDLGASADSIVGVVINAVAKDEGGIGRGLKLTAKSGTTTGRSDEIALSTAYAFYQKLFEDNPDTTSAWTPSEVNGAQFGYQVSS